MYPKEAFLRFYSANWIADSFVMLATAARFHDLHMSDVRVEKYSKYTREHYSAVFDNLHTKKEWSSTSSSSLISMFSLGDT